MQTYVTYDLACSQRMCFASRLDGLSIKDLVQPEKTRTMNSLSAVINFVKFTEEQVEFVKDLQAQSNLRYEQHQKVVGDNQLLAGRVDALRYT